MSKHTPAPWTIREGDTSITVVGANGEALYHDDKRLPGVIEDARLIAAAPELLKALEGLVRCWETDIALGYPVDRYYYAEAKAAIAKAKGETQ